MSSVFYDLLVCLIHPLHSMPSLTYRLLRNLRSTRQARGFRAPPIAPGIGGAIPSTVRNTRHRLRSRTSSQPPSTTSHADRVQKQERVPNSTSPTTLTAHLGLRTKSIHGAPPRKSRHHTHPPSRGCRPWHIATASYKRWFHAIVARLQDINAHVIHRRRTRWDWRRLAPCCGGIGTGCCGHRCRGSGGWRQRRS